MGNHYHLVMSVGERGLSAGMCELNTALRSVVQQGARSDQPSLRQAVLERRLRTEASLFNAVRYVDQNPRRAGEPGPLETHVWTSYAATIGLAFAEIRLARDEVLAFFGQTPERAIAAISRGVRGTCPARLARWQPP